MAKNRSIDFSPDMSVQSFEAMGSKSNPIYIFSHISVLKFQELMAEQDSQYLFELDGNKNADELFKVSLFFKE